MKMKNSEVSRLVGAYCRGFRRAYLKKTLQEVSGESNLKTLSGFENGRSSNLFHIFKYLDSCETPTMRGWFLKGLCEILEEVSTNVKT